MLLMLDWYLERVLSCDEDLRNSSTQLPRWGDFDLGRLQRSSKTCGVREARSLSASFFFVEPQLSRCCCPSFMEPIPPIPAFEVLPAPGLPIECKPPRS